MLSDDAIDQALFTYTAVQARPGLESRVLHSVTASRELAIKWRNPLTLWPWSIVALSVVFVAALSAAVWTHIQSTTRPSQSAHNGGPVAQARLQPERNLQTLKEAVRPKLVRASLAHFSVPISRKPVEKAEPVVPAPPTLTDQERLLALLATKSFGEALTFPVSQPIALARLEDHRIEIRALSTQPISITPIRIAALQSAPSLAP